MPKKILLADDSITIQKVVELTFSDGDYEVTAVNNGAKAVQKLSEMRPDIILSDIIMPEKNGYEVCEYVKSHPEFRNIPVVLLTGTFEPFDPDRAEKAGCDAVVTKPFESQSLIHKVEELIASARSAAPAPAAPEPEAAAPSPWVEETPEPPPPVDSPFGGFTSTPEAYTHGSDIFGAAQPAPAPQEMSFDGPADSPFGANVPAEEFSGETRAFPRMSFEEMQQMASQQSAPSAPAPAPEPPAAPEPSPWDEQPEPAFGGETRAFPRMTFDEMQQMAQSGSSQSAPPAPAPEPESPFGGADFGSGAADSPFGANVPAEEFSGETRAFPRMSFEEMQQMANASSPSAPPPAPEPPSAPESLPWDDQASAFPSFDSAPAAPGAPEPSPWDEQPAAAFGGETRAFPKMSFDEMQNLASQSAPPPQPEPAPWEEPAAPAWSPEPAPEVPAYSQQSSPEDMPFAAEAAAPPEETYEQEVPPPQQEPVWAPVAAAEAKAEPAEPAVPSPALAPEQSPSIPIRGELSDGDVDRIARRVVELMSDQVVRNIAWEVIPDLAEVVVKERIRQLESEA
jgi:CheY-like chemotaxis protein